MASSCNRFKENSGHRHSYEPSHSSQQICDEYQRNDTTCSTEQNKCDEHVELLIAKVSAQAEEIGRLKAEVDELRAKLFAIAGVSDQGSEVKHSCITQRTFTQELCKLALSENQPRIESRRPQDSKRHEPLIVTIPMLEAACRNATLGGSDICSLTRLGDLKCGESIQDMAQEAVSDGILDCTFEMYAGGASATCQSFQSRVMLPTNAASYIWMSPGGKKIMNHLTHQAAAEAVAAFRRHHSYLAEFRCFIRSCSEGDYSGIKSRNHSFWSDEKTSYLYVISLPCILLDEENGVRMWCMMRIWEKCEVAKINRAWALRDMLMLKGTPVPMNMVDPVTGILIWQNQTSKNEIGVHGLDNKEFWCLGQGQEGLDYLSLLFNKDEALQKEMHALLAEGGQFKRRLKIKSRKLKRMLRVEPHLSAWHDVHISLLQDPVTSKEMLLILEVDVTAAVLSEKRVEELQRQQLMLLQQILPEQVIDVLLQKLSGNAAEPGQKSVVSAPGMLLEADTGAELCSVSLQRRKAQDRSDNLQKESHGSGLCPSDVLAPQNLGSTTAVELPDLSEQALQEAGSPTGVFADFNIEQALHHGGFGDALKPDLILPSSVLQALGSTASLRNSHLLERGYSCSSDSTSFTPGSITMSHLGTHDVLLTPGGPGKESSLLTQQNVMDLAAWHESVTVLFCDIEGFTTLSSQLHPAEVMLLLNDLFSRFDALLEKHDVYKVETIGDCYMCVTGLFNREDKPKEQDAGKTMESVKGLIQIGDTAKEVESDAEGEEASCIAEAEDICKGLKCHLHRHNTTRRHDGGWGKLGGFDPQHATKMLCFARALVRTARQVPNPLGGHIRVRTGMHSGPVCSGVVGKRMPRFCLFGDTVNTASRMETTCPIPGRIHVSATSAALIPGVVLEPCTVHVKGKGEMNTFLDPST